MKKFASCVFILCAATSLMRAQDSRLDPELARVGAADAPAHVIVRFRQGVEGASYSRFGARVKHRKNLHVINSALYEVRSQEDLQTLLADPDVEFVAPDRVVTATTFQGTPDYAWMQTLGVNTNFGTAAFDGTGVTVAVVDSGVTMSPDFRDSKLASRIVYSANFTADADATDGFGHGTFIAGLIASNGAGSAVPSLNNYWIRGMAPNANVVNMKVLDSAGVGTDSAVIAAIDAILKLPTSLKVRVINLSLGRPVTSACAVDPLCQAVGRAWQAGYVVVVAAGNDGRNPLTQGYGTINAPGNSPYVITVGASNTQGQLAWSGEKMASYSSKGPTMIDHFAKPDLVAPGNRILSLRVKGSTLDTLFPVNQVPLTVYSKITSNIVLNYFQLSGTSMSTAVASGGVALVLQAYPNYTPDQVKELLMATAYKFPQQTSVATDATTGVSYTTTYDLFTVGAGDLNIAAALASTNTPPVISMQSPAVAYDATTKSVKLSSPNMTFWGTNTLWGSHSLWGNTVLSGTMSLWGSNSLWGTSGTTSFNSLWGTHSLWGSSTPSADSLAVAVNGEN